MSIRVAAVVVALLACLHLGLAAQTIPHTMIVSVQRIDAPTPPKTGEVLISVMVHYPTDLQGTRLILLTGNADRGHVRAQFPLGSLQLLGLAEPQVETLRDELSHSASIERQIDKGIRAEMISDAVSIPTLRLTELASPPKPFLVFPGK